MNKEEDITTGKNPAPPHPVAGPIEIGDLYKLLTLIESLNQTKRLTQVEKEYIEESFNKVDAIIENHKKVNHQNKENS